MKCVCVCVRACVQYDSLDTQAELLLLWLDTQGIAQYKGTHCCIIPIVHAGMFKVQGNVNWHNFGYVTN